MDLGVTGFDVCGTESMCNKADGIATGGSNCVVLHYHRRRRRRFARNGQEGEGLKWVRR